jgi:hypothetical protein
VRALASLRFLAEAAAARDGRKGRRRSALPDLDHVDSRTHPAPRDALRRRDSVESASLAVEELPSSAARRPSPGSFGDGLRWERGMSEGHSAARASRTDAGFVRRLLVLCDRLSLVAIAAGLAVELQPFWRDGLRVGFVVTLAAVVAQILFGHLAAAPAAE